MTKDFFKLTHDTIPLISITSLDRYMEEIWKNIPGYGDFYMASNLGRIKVKERNIKKFCGLHNKIVEQTYKEKILSPSKTDKYGHMSVHLGISKQKFTIGVHRLVLFAFVGMPEIGQEGCHNNGIAFDNRIENLRWDTHANNNADRKKHGNYPTGKEHPMYGRKMTDELKKKLLTFNLGVKKSEETKKRQSEAQKKRYALQKQKVT